MLFLPVTGALVGALVAEPELYIEPPPPEVVIAGIVYTGNRGEDEEPTYVCDEEEDDLEPCEVEELVRQAAADGASLVVVSEAAFELAAPERAPAIGERPNGERTPVLRRFSALADELDLYLVIQLELVHAELLHSGQVAFDPSGSVVGRHFKMELYDAENDTYAPGSDVSVFRTPFGRVGMLICSDLYADPQYHTRLAGQLKADIVALSSIWTVDDATRWQAAFAHDWRVVLIAANGAAGDGRGAGIFGPDGQPWVITHDGRDEVVSAVLD